MIVLDTNVMSELMRRAPDTAVVAWLDRQSAATLFTTAVTLAELRYGVASLPAGRRRTDLSTLLENVIRPMFGPRVLHFDEPASEAYARIRATARQQGHHISSLDAMIAAMADVRNYVVATRDAAFVQAGIRTVNPFV